MPDQPTVSIIVPCYNEQATIGKLLDSLRAQTYPHDKMEVVIADGMSTDGTRTEIESFKRRHPGFEIRVMENRARTIPSGVNQAIREARGAILIRLDAHSMPIPEYVERCVTAHQNHRGDNIGGVWEIRPGAETRMAESIAAAAAHPLGVGDALYRLNAKAGAVDTVPFGSFRRELIERIGAFDETLLSNEDYEFNARVRQAGGVVWLDPSIRCVYFSRPTLGKLAAQYWRYGFWKFRMLRRYPHTLRWRQALPPVFVLIFAALIVLSLWFGVARALLAAQLSVYFFALGLAGSTLAIRTRKGFHLWGLPSAIATMHFSWGAGFLWSGLAGMFKNG
ncbi:MAG: glycosyltransferase family 2 protein [Chloroflexi bacterium]|nr:glycosyltransferase family 2 protein [Chloroflexi bacterium CFX1]MCK6569254.1 glycosyltransferase family 2 protein [Anaerolineales bacterium]MCQ3954364.1 glycosyltransferase family 2 protein [Chloroflexota bacterium]MDL1919087.1 glycosyltransferase family 2 protein [Chloroflexi bacterium CFX5]NUQ59986.1 glycosyltransferase family 2 protein [Anaerolineales bacterium]